MKGEGVAGVKARPRWLFVVPWGLEHPGGVNQVVLNLFKACEDDGRYEPRILVLDWSKSWPQKVSGGPLPATVWRVRSPFDGNGGVKAKVRYAAGFGLAVCVLRKMVGGHSESVINMHYPTRAAYFFVAARRIGRFPWKLILSYHGMDVAALESGSACQRTAQALALHRADVIVTCSNALARRLRKLSPADSGRVHVVHNGVDPAAFEALRGRRGGRAQGSALRLLSIGTFEDKKGQDVLVRALSELRGRGLQCELTLVGRTGAALDRLRALTIRLGLTAAVRFVVDVPHDMIGNYLESADVFVLPSRAEPFGIVLLEAGLFKLPVVASAVGGVLEIISGGEDGLLVPPEDVAALVDAIELVARDEVLRTRLGDALKKKVIGCFTWGRAFEEYRALARSCI